LKNILAWKISMLELKRVVLVNPRVV